MRIEPKQNPNIRYLWPTPILTRRLKDYREINAELVSLFSEYRREFGRGDESVFASRDDLHRRYGEHPAMSRLIRFINDSVFEVASDVNAPFWTEGQEIRVRISGVWFQVSNNHCFHETHVHGNCSWSGVYYVQSGQCSRGPDDKPNGMLNGITRFYGPHMEHIAGGYGDLGGLFQQNHSYDVYPADGVMVVFPAYLKHMVFPYSGSVDRIAVSFHASVFGPGEYRPSYAFG